MDDGNEGNHARQGHSDFHHIRTFVLSVALFVRLYQRGGARGSVCRD